MDPHVSVAGEACATRFRGPVSGQRGPVGPSQTVAWGGCLLNQCSEKNAMGSAGESSQMPQHEPGIS